MFFQATWRQTCLVKDINEAFSRGRGLSGAFLGFLGLFRGLAMSPSAVAGASQAFGPFLRVLGLWGA